MSTTFTRLDKLLGIEISPAIAHIPDAEAVVADCLEWNQQAFTKWIKSRGFSHEQHVRDHFKEILDTAEKELGMLHDWGDLTRMQDLKRAVRFLSAYQLPQRENAYLRQDSALILLAKLPPANLMQAMNVRSIEDIFYTFTALDVIALTRHTESSAWQDAYLDELARLGPAHFETRAIRFLVVDRDFLRKASAAAGHHLKPWSVSHNKETGTLTFYTFDPVNHLATPRLLLVMLFFHYYFETLRAARLAYESGKHPPEEIGKCFSLMICSTRRTFSFSNPNVHSEALYWEDAIAYISTIFPKLAFREYMSLLSCGEFMEEIAQEPVSLNLIDHLWNVNLDHQSGYFAHQETTFLYHFRETFWSEILQTLQRLSKNEMRSSVFAQLELDDLALTQRMLERSAVDIEIDPASPPWLSRRS